MYIILLSPEKTILFGIMSVAVPPTRRIYDIVTSLSDLNAIDAIDDQTSVKIVLPQAMIDDPRLVEEHKSLWIAHLNISNGQFNTDQLQQLGSVALLFPNTDVSNFANWCTMFSNIRDDHVEPIAKADPERFSLEPIRFPGIWDFRESLDNLHWRATEVDLANDRVDLKKLTLQERHMLEYVLGILNVADVMIIDQIAVVLDKHIKVMEGEAYMLCVGHNEMTHNQSYSRQTTALIRSDRRQKIFDSVKTMSTVGQMADWVRFWTITDHASADLFVALAFIEGAMFSGLFAAIQYFVGLNVLSGVTTLNEWTCRDENIHSLFWIHMVNDVLTAKPDPEVVESIARETARLCRLFFNEALSNANDESLSNLAEEIGDEYTEGRPMTINAEKMSQYCEFVCDTILIKLGNEPIFGRDNPLSYMDDLSLNKTMTANFFERTVSGYQELSEGALAFRIHTSWFDS